MSYILSFGQQTMLTYYNKNLLISLILCIALSIIIYCEPFDITYRTLQLYQTSSQFTVFRHFILHLSQGADKRRRGFPLSISITFCIFRLLFPLVFLIDSCVRVILCNVEPHFSHGSFTTHWWWVGCLGTLLSYLVGVSIIVGSNFLCLFITSVQPTVGCIRRGGLSIELCVDVLLCVALIAC